MKFDDKTHTGIFLGYHCHAGGKWSGEHWVCSKEDIINCTDVRINKVRTGSLITEPYQKEPVCPFRVALEDAIHECIKDIQRATLPQTSIQDAPTPFDPVASEQAPPEIEDTQIDEEIRKARALQARPDPQTYGQKIGVDGQRSERKPLTTMPRKRLTRM